MIRLRPDTLNCLLLQAAYLQLHCLFLLSAINLTCGAEKASIQMHYGQLSPSGYLLFLSLVVIAFLALLTRAGVFLRREMTGTRAVYPATWNEAQCRALKYFRLFVGLTLILLWCSFLSFAPSIRTDMALGHLDWFFLFLLLGLSDAWVLLLIPRNWKQFGAISRSFPITITFLALWWITMLTATEWMLVKVSIPSNGFSGAYAERNVGSFYR